ncbi:MAG: PD40 domain-containing protein [Sandaracinaceae bacterium]|nr:PD40 domain-containing protein [Sandaracinaceae bacterium]
MGARRGVWSATALLFAAACAPDEHLLVVELRSDLVPGVEIDRVRVLVDGAARAELALGRDDALASGVRVAETTLPAGAHDVLAVLERNGSAVLERAVRVEVVRATSVTVLATRDCRGVRCPADDATASACLGGACVRPECTPETPEACPAPACRADADCAPAGACAVGRCAGGACLAVGEDVCGPALYCDPDRGCAALPDECAQWGPWQDAAPIAEVNDPSGDDWGPWMSPDGLRLYFSSERGGGLGGQDLYVAARASAAAPFGAPARIEALSTALEDSDPSLSADELEIFWYGGAVPYTLFTARRADLRAPFGAAAPLAIDDPRQNDITPAVRADGLELFFSRDGNDSGFDLFRATRATRADAFGDVQHLAALASGATDCCPGASSDGSTLYFEETDGSRYEIRVASRPSADAPFGAPVPVPELSAGRAAGDPQPSADGRTIVFAGRLDGGSWDIWRASRACVR